MTRPLLAAAALAAAAYSGLLLLLPRPVRRAALDLADAVTAHIVALAAAAWEEEA